MRSTSTARPQHRWAAIVATVAAAAVSLVVPATPSQAADASNFDPGYIIDDALFFDGGAMTASQIDAFIAAKNPGCASGQICIENYRETITAKTATTRCGAIAAKSNATAGDIIAAVGRACGISPKAIIVILQKEQSLITSTAPSTRAFAYAMGAGCPDTAACNEDYAGFYEQVYYGASLLKGYTLTSSSLYGRYAAGATSNILYNPKSSCGTKSVYVRNQATHALYVYTPYTPNAAALANLYGTGDGCSAYGNRNFWRLYSDWFGSPTVVGAGSIDDYWASQGGASGWLGEKTGELAQLIDSNGGLVQPFEGGYVVWSKAYGAHSIWGAILNFWRSRGGPASNLGWPMEDNVKTTANAGGRSQLFSGGLVAVSGTLGTYKIYGNAHNRYKWTGLTEGPLGFPTTNLYRDEISGLQAQDFEGGTIFLDGATSTWIPRQLKTRVDASGGPTGLYGWPTSLPQSYGDAGYTQDFRSATLTWTEADGVRSVFGGIRKAWQQYGGSRGPLGWPTADMGRDAATQAAVQSFEGGTVYALSSKLGWVAKEFGERYEASGGLSGVYGWPKLGPVDDPAGGGGVRQDFARATLTTVGDGEVVSIFGGMYKAWMGLGGTQGGLAWPTGSLYKDAATGLSAQNFGGGTLYIQGSTSAWVSKEFVEWVSAAGGVTGNYGWPEGEPWISTIKGGGVRQDFRSASLTWTEESGVHSVFASLKTAWLAYGGVDGPLGWPTSQMQRDPASGYVVQDFQGGRVYVDGSRRTWVPIELVQAVEDAGGLQGPLGWPTGALTVTDTRVAMIFSGGAAVWTQDGGVVVSTK